MNDNPRNLLVSDFVCNLTSLYYMPCQDLLVAFLLHFLVAFATEILPVQCVIGQGELDVFQFIERFGKKV